MMGIGFSEMLLIAGLALVVIGPEKFPDFAKLVIRTIRDLRGYVDEVKSEVTKELKPIKDEMKSLSKIDPEKYIDSLTSEAPEKKTATTTPVHEADRAVMDEAYGEDPYGWQDGEESDYRADKGAYPEETVGYGETVADESTTDTLIDRREESGTKENDTGDTGVDEVKSTAPETPEDEFDAIRNAAKLDQDGESDVWTGR